MSAEIGVDLRATGLRVCSDSAEHAEAASAAARDLGLSANPAVLQQLSVVLESANPSVVRPFWQRALDYAPAEDDDFAHPLRRDPAILIRQSTEPRPLRNRIHLDVVRPATAVEQAGPGDRAGVSDIHDPRRLNPVLVFQELDVSETERRRQRNRIHFELAVPSDLAQTRLAASLAAGGRLLDESADHWRVADPEGNEMVIVSGA